MVVHLRYSADLYDRETAMRRVADYLGVLEACAAAPTIVAAALGMQAPCPVHPIAAPGQAERGDPGGAQPRTATEHALLAMWRRVIGRDDIGVTDDFFESGGNSLSALRLLAAVEQTFNVRLPLPSMFELPTVSTTAASIDEASR